MKSYVNLHEGVLVVGLNNLDCCQVHAGETLTDEHHPLDPEAHISIAPLDTIDLTYVPAQKWGERSFVQNVGRASLVVVKRTLDTMCYVPREVLRDTRLAAERIDTANLIIIEEDDVAAEIRTLFPDSGVELRFNGSGRFYERSLLDYPDR